MKKLLASTALAVTLLMSGCAGADAPDSKAAQNPAPKVQTAQNKTQQSQAAAQGIKLKLQVDGKNIIVVLADNAAAKRLIDMLPAGINLNDFNHTEKIGYFKNKLTGDGAPRGHAPKAGDVCVYVPWGNISVFYKDFRYTDDLIYLGHVEQGLDILSTQQSDFKVNFSIEH